MLKSGQPQKRVIEVGRSFGMLVLALAATISLAAADPRDHGTPQTAVDAAYAVISGPDGAVDQARFDDVFTSTARFVMVTRAADGDATVQTMDAAGFKRLFAAMIAGKPFFERGRTIHADVRGNVATIISDYQSRTSPEGAPVETGRNTFELVRGRAGWRVDSIFWEAGTGRR